MLTTPASRVVPDNSRGLPALRANSVDANATTESAMSQPVRITEYAGLIPCRIAALGPSRQPQPRLPGLQHAVYRLIVWLSRPSLPAAPSRAPAQSPETAASGIS